MNTILLTILEDASSAPFQPEDFLSKIFGNFWSLLINLLALLVLFLVLGWMFTQPAVLIVVIIVVIVIIACFASK